MLKKLENFDCYFVDDAGSFYSKKSGNMIELKQSFDKDGYRIISLQVDKKRLTFRSHRLVAKTFLENPDDLPVVMHLDDNPSNNSISNLKWSTYTENNRSCFSKGRQTTTRGSDIPWSKLKESDVKEIKYLLLCNFSHQQIANNYGVHKETIGLINRGKNWKHIK